MSVDGSLIRHQVEGASGDVSPFQHMMGDILAGFNEKREAFEDRGEDAARAQLRQIVGEKTSKREVDHFLALMRERGGGSIAVAWRRYFDSDGDGELSFSEFCNALVELSYEGDVLRLWHDLSNSEENIDSLSLEDLDKESAAALEFFGRWCAENFGGPSEFFTKIDADGDAACSPEELAQGLTWSGFFTAEGVPTSLCTEEKILKNLYPLLDQTGSGACSCEQLMFLEKDRTKRDRILRELARIREYGHDGAEEPLRSNAQRMLHKLATSCTPVGGKHWAAVTDEVAVGQRSPSASLSTSTRHFGASRSGHQHSRRLMRNS